MVVLGLVSLVVLEPFLVVASGRVAGRATRKHKQRTLAATGFLWVVLYVVVSSRSHLLSEKVEQFSQVSRGDGGIGRGTTERDKCSNGRALCGDGAAPRCAMWLWMVVCMIAV